jgi:hypothetical protein
MIVSNIATLLDVSPRALTDWLWVLCASVRQLSPLADVPLRRSPTQRVFAASQDGLPGIRTEIERGNRGSAGMLCAAPGAPATLHPARSKSHRRQG